MGAALIEKVLSLCRIFIVSSRFVVNGCILTLITILRKALLKEGSAESSTAKSHAMMVRKALLIVVTDTCTYS